MGTNLSRSRVMNDLLIKGGRSEYLEICGPETEVTLDSGPIKPCAEFDGRPITAEAIMRPLGQQYDGYNATALAGIWAGAPYLHNGSVPTMYHLLMPQTRPASFTKSALNYDTEKLGFAWDATGCRTDCSWFGFKIAVKTEAPFSRTELAQELDRHRIGNRMLFGGNLLRQPAFVQLRQDRPEALRVVGEMMGSDEIMITTLFMGTYPGLTKEMLKAEIKAIKSFAQENMA
jgi:hypothetical protein